MADNNNANLLIGVGLDMAPLRADKARLEQEIRGIKGGLNKQIAAGDEAGSVATAANLIAHEKQLAAVNAQISKAGKEAGTWRDTLKEITEHSSKLREAFEIGGGIAAGGGGLGMLGSLGRLVAGHPLLAAGGAVVGALGISLHEAAEYSREVEASANVLGLSTGQMDDWIKAARSAHVEQETAIKAWERFGIAVEKAAEKQRGLTFDTNRLMAAHGQLDSVLRGGETDKPRKQTSHLVDAGGGTGSLVGGFDHRDEASLQIHEQQQAELRRIAEQNVRQLQDAKNQFGGSFNVPSVDTEYQRIKLEANKRTKEGEELRKLLRERDVPGVGAASPKEALDALQQKQNAEPFSKLHIAVTDLSGETRKLGETYAEYRIAFRNLNATLANQIQRTLMGRGGLNPELQQSQRRTDLDPAFASKKGDSEAISAGVEIAHVEKAAIEAVWRTMIDTGLKEAQIAVGTAEKMSEIANEIKHKVSEIWGGVKEAAGATADALNKIPEAASKAAAAMSAIGQGKGTGGELLGNAEGGYISGPGTGTSDSIVARLSNGEFVVNAASTSRNLGLLHAINTGGYAMGGLVGFPSLPRFAEGGPVGKTPVHVHIGGNEYQLHGSEAVAGALVAASQSQQMRSGGPKPTWYGR
jgi:hypothetical protein